MISVRKLQWYAARLRSMSAAEIVFRLRRAASGLLALWRQRYPRPNSYYLAHDAPDAPASADGAFRSLRARLHLPDPAIARRSIVAGCPDAIPSTVASAQHILSGTLRFFDQTWQYGPDWHWHRDPRHDALWPLRHWTRVDIRKGGAKYVWEPNRHQQLITLGKAWYWTHDPAFSAELERAFRTWLAQNPPYFGVHWTSAIELSIRVVSWCWALAFAGDAPELTEDTKQKLFVAISLQVAHIRGHLSAHSSANNHLIAEAAALAITGMLFPALPASGDWTMTGMDILTRELVRQVQADGVNGEQAIHYHGEVLEWYLLVASIDRRRGGSAHRAWQRRLLKMALFLERIGDCNNNVPEYGDSDDARVAPLTEVPANYYQSLRTISALLFDDASVLRGDEPYDECAFWLCGSGIPPRAEPPPPVPCVTVFPHGGWVIDRPPQMDHARHNPQLAFNCGALGYGPIAAHGHADALSVWLSVNGVPMLIDPGTGTYHEDARIRSYFRSTRAHNTLVIDDLDQSVQTGPTIWRNHAPVRLELSGLPPGGIARGIHLGYRRLPDPVTHERTIVRCEPRAYLVLDRVHGAAGHHLCLHWHTLPGTRVTRTADSSCLIAYQGEQIRLWWSGAQISCRLFEGSMDPMLGWYSPAYGRYVPSPVIRLECTAALPVTLLTIIDLDLDDPIESYSVESADQEILSVCLKRTARTAHYRLSPGSLPPDSQR